MSRVLDWLGRFPPFRKVVNYCVIEKELLYSCPACKASAQESSITFAQLDRYGFPVTTKWCLCCDLLYLNPRPTSAAYKNFYDSGDYRRLITAFSGHENDHLIPQTRVIQVASLLKKLVPSRPLSVLNIGGTRADYEVLSGQISIGNYVCLNPGGEEAGEGYKVLSQTLEGYDPDGDVFDVVCLLGTLNHLTEPGEAFKKINRMMTQDSVFVFDYKDPLAKMARMTQPIGGLQFDHATYPTRRTLGLMMDVAGLNLLKWHTDNQRLYTFFAAQKLDQILPEIVTVRESSLIDDLRHRAGRMPRKLALQVLRSFMGMAR
jgi:hypothetical protein